MKEINGVWFVAGFVYARSHHFVWFYKGRVEDVEAFVDEVRVRGTIDPMHWSKVSTF